jgi:hypothetical protein
MAETVVLSVERRHRRMRLPCIQGIAIRVATRARRGEVEVRLRALQNISRDLLAVLFRELALKRKSAVLVRHTMQKENTETYLA